MIMRNRFFVIALAGICALPGLRLNAQQKPHYTQYILNQYIINPAITGIENYWDVKLSHRHQWTGLQDNPVTSYFTVHGAIGKEDSRTTATSYSIPGRNPRGESYWESYNAAEPHHGVGLQVINDVTGPLSSFSAYGTYAYHLGLNATTSLSAGIGVGVNRISLDASKLDFGDFTVDPAVYGTDVLNNLPLDMMAGVYLYSSHYFIGVSAQQIIPQKIDFSNGAIKTQEGKTVPHLFGMAGYRLMPGEDWNLIPSVMVKYVHPLPVQYEGNLKLQYRDLAWIGGSYRHKDGFAGMAGLNISNTFNVGYAYDYTTSELNNYSKGTHEVIVGFLIGNRYPDRCPKNVW